MRPIMARRFAPRASSDRLARMHDDEDPERQAILKRRQRWVALALAGASAGIGTACTPTPCLDIAVPEDAGQDAGPDDEDAGG